MCCAFHGRYFFSARANGFVKALNRKKNVQISAAESERCGFASSQMELRIMKITTQRVKILFVS